MRLRPHDYSNLERKIVDSTSYNETGRDVRQGSVKEDDGKRPLYNKHPRFCWGNYEIFNVDVINDKGWEREGSGKKLISYIDLLTKCTFKIEEFGKCTITNREEKKEEDQEKRDGEELGKKESANELDKRFTDKSLSKLKKMFGKKDSEKDRGFMEQLKREPIKTYKVEELVENTEVASVSREDLEKFVENTVLGEATPTSKDGVEAVNWEYVPSSKLVRIGIFLKEMSKRMYLTFKLHPGTKPLVIDNGVLKVERNGKSTANIGSICGSGSGDGMQNRGRDASYSSRALVKVKSVEEDAVNQAVKRDRLHHKRKVISVSGNSRSRFNRIFGLIQALASNLGTSAPSKGESKASEAKVAFDTESPLEFATISVRVNSQQKFLVPLLTYVDMADGRAYLCNCNVPIEATPSRVWPLRNGTYAEYNMRFVPECYRNAAFFSNADVEFRPEDILKVLSSHLEFKKLVYESDPEGRTKDLEEFLKEDLKFEKDVSQGSQGDPEAVEQSELREPMDEKGSGRGKGEDYSVYHVNGANKIIYKPCEGAILINLLV
nr:hypothetical protein MACL_00000694 [Theileria orientalis]